MLASVLVLAIGYIWLIHWLVFARGGFASTYHPVIGRLLRWRGMQAVTLGARCYLATPTARLTITGFRHEAFHYYGQWRQYPYTFLPRYLFLLARYGYDRHPMEQAARLDAGEPTR